MIDYLNAQKEVKTGAMCHEKAQSDMNVDGEEIAAIQTKEIPVNQKGEQYAAVFPKDYHPNKNAQNDYWRWDSSKSWNEYGNGKFEPMPFDELMKMWKHQWDQIPKPPPGYFRDLYQNTWPYIAPFIP